MSYYHPKFKDYRAHTLKRAKKRFSGRFNRKIYLNAINCIKEQRKVGCCTPIKRLGRGHNRKRSAWLIQIESKYCLVIYDHKAKAIVTLLREADKNGGRIKR